MDGQNGQKRRPSAAKSQQWLRYAKCTALKLQLGMQFSKKLGVEGWTKGGAACGAIDYAGTIVHLQAAFVLVLAKNRIGIG